MRFTGPALQKGGHGLAGNIGHEPFHGAGTGVNSCALSLDENRFTAANMQEFEPCLSLEQKYPNLAVGNDLPV